jgi:hypothetical protein
MQKSSLVLQRNHYYRPAIPTILHLRIYDRLFQTIVPSGSTMIIGVQSDLLNEPTTTSMMEVYTLSMQPAICPVTSTHLYARILVEIGHILQEIVPTMHDSLRERNKSGDMLTPMASQLACIWTKIRPGIIYAVLLIYRRMSRFGWPMIPYGKRKFDLLVIWNSTPR